MFNLSFRIIIIFFIIYVFVAELVQTEEPAVWEMFLWLILTAIKSCIVFVMQCYEIPLQFVDKITLLVVNMQLIEID